MECNKDEAFRAKSIAESKLEKQDFVGAKRFALKAQTLYPGLDGIPQMLTILDVYVSAENKIGGEVDWYGVLGINPSANDDAIKKQYRKLALMLHPDKNKAFGADGAFKLISEAWNLLSDKVKRVAYNQKRGFRVFQQNHSVHTGGPPAQARTHTSGPSAQAQMHTNGPATQTRTHTNGPSTQAETHTSGPSTQTRMHTGGSSTQARTHAGCPSMKSKETKYKFPNKKSSVAKSQKRSSVVPPAAHSPPYDRPGAFWTICKGCKIHYEYLMVYLDQYLLCPTCKEPFFASRVALPVNYSKSFKAVPWVNCNFPTQNGTGSVAAPGSGRTAN